VNDKHDSGDENDPYNLLPPSLEKILPLLYATEKVAKEKKIAYAKYFAPYTSWRWFVLEGQWNPDHNDFIFFGLAYGFEKEYGYFSLIELKSVTHPLHRIERDLYFKPALLPDCVKNN
jgi:hypothetical protein